MALKINKSYLFSAFILAFAVLFSFFVLNYRVQAQTSTQTVQQTGVGAQTSPSITYPVPELGNCANQDACHSYCAQPANMQACISFAKSRGLVNSQEADKASQFARAIESGKTPGGCTSPDSCESYCSDITHINECISFAKGHNISNEHVAQGEKIAAYLKAGGKMPGGCTSEESCRSYCGDFSHAEECFAFAKNAGIQQASGVQTPNGGEMTADQLQKFLQLAANGQTPGGCKSKDECESYCQNDAHRQECLDFGVKAGFVSEKEAEQIKATGGKGPGGCDSPASCQAYCNDPSHNAECLKFAEDHGFISKEDADSMRNNLTQVRSGLNNAPPEVVSCLNSTLGSSTVSGIENGQLLPSPDLSDQVRSCFEKFGQQKNASQIFSHLPSEVAACVKQKLGDDFDKVESGQEMPTPDMGDAVRECFGQSQQNSQGEQEGENNVPSGAGFQSSEGLKRMIENAPPDVAACTKQAVGDELSKAEGGDAQTAGDVSQKVQKCFRNFQPGGIHRQGNQEDRQNEGEGSGRQYFPGQAGFASGTPPMPNGQFPQPPTGYPSGTMVNPPYPGMNYQPPSGSAGNYQMPNLPQYPATYSSSTPPPPPPRPTTTSSPSSGLEPAPLGNVLQAIGNFVNNFGDR